jgi:formimidoylglutamate deiminase
VKQVARAAREVGLRLTLLRVAYARAGHGLPENPLQRRFLDRSVDEVVRSLEDLESGLRDEWVSLGAAPHSVRACPAGWIERLAAESRRRSLPLHVHVSEQPAEVAQCRAEHASGGGGTGRPAAFPSPAIRRDGPWAPGNLARHHRRPRRRTSRPLAAGSAWPGRRPTPKRSRRGLEAPAAHGVAKHPAGGIDRLGRRTGKRSTGAGAAAAAVPGDPTHWRAWTTRRRLAEDLLPAAVFGMARTAVRDVYVGGEPALLSGAPARVPAEVVVQDFRDTMRKLWG